MFCNVLEFLKTWAKRLSATNNFSTFSSIIFTLMNMLSVPLLCRFSRILLSTLKGILSYFPLLKHIFRDSTVELSLNTTYLLDLFKKNVVVRTFSWKRLFNILVEWSNCFSPCLESSSWAYCYWLILIPHYYAKGRQSWIL